MDGQIVEIVYEGLTRQNSLPKPEKVTDVAFPIVKE